MLEGCKIEKCRRNCSYIRKEILLYQHMQTFKQAWKTKSCQTCPRTSATWLLRRGGILQNGGVNDIRLQRIGWIITLQGLSVWGLFPAQLFCTSFARHSCTRIEKLCSEFTRLRSIWIKNCLFVNCKELQHFKFTHYFNPTSSILHQANLVSKNKSMAAAPCFLRFLSGKRET